MSGRRRFVCGLTVGFGAAAAIAAAIPDGRVNARHRIVVDGTPRDAWTGEEIEIPCAHAEGRIHRIRLGPAERLRYAGPEVAFEGDPAVQIEEERTGSERTIYLDTASGPRGTLKVAPGPEDPAAALVRAIAEFKDDFKKKDLETFEEMDSTLILKDRVVKGRRLQYLYGSEEWRTEFYAFPAGEHALLLSWQTRVADEDQAESLLRVLRDSFSAAPAPPEGTGPAPKKEPADGKAPEGKGDGK